MSASEDLLLRRRRGLGITFAAIREVWEPRLLILRDPSLPEVTARDGAKDSVMVRGWEEIGLVGSSGVNGVA